MFAGDIFTLSVDNGEEYEYEVVLTHTDTNTGNTYLIYTDCIDSEDDEMTVYFAQEIIDENGDKRLISVQTEEEMKILDDILDDYLND